MIHYWKTDNSGIRITGGVWAIITSFWAFWTGVGELLNPLYNRNMLPIGRPKELKSSKEK